MSIVKKLSLYATISTLGMSTFVGCGHSEDTNQEEVIAEESSKEQEDVTEIKYFDVGEHLFFERYYLTSSVDSQDIAGGSVSIPEGYSVYDIENFTRPYRYGSETGGYDVWFLNDVPVEAEKVYNEVLEIYDYSEPGTPVLEKSDAAVQKVK